mmetsp:Transcript_17676/g.68602  ORF Transcript_17676/g.68602 Transcript_17676/m.68602 type:complete len:210 (-) Transcript_17676:787-1416(-)
MPEPTRFLLMLSSTMRSTVVLRTSRTTSARMTASQTTDRPRPSIQFTAEAFLSVQKLPERLRTQMSGKIVRSLARALSVPFDTMFMPIASPVVDLNRMKTVRPASTALICRRRPKFVVLSKTSFSTLKPCWLSTYCLTSTAREADGSCMTGARVMPLLSRLAAAPPLALMALQPRCVEATRQPSVVAMGITMFSPLIMSGPAMPTGTPT